MGPAVFVLRKVSVPQYETAPRGTALGRKTGFCRRREDRPGNGV